MNYINHIVDYLHLLIFLLAMEIIEAIVHVLKVNKDYQRLYNLQHLSYNFAQEIYIQRIFNGQKKYFVKICAVVELRDKVALYFIKILQSPLPIIKYHYLNRITSIKDKISHLMIINKLLYPGYKTNIKYSNVVHNSTPLTIIQNICTMCNIATKYTKLDPNAYREFHGRIKNKKNVSEWLMLWLVIMYFEPNILI